MYAVGKMGVDVNKEHHDHQNAPLGTPLVSNRDAQLDPKPLKAVPPKKIVFVSRLASDTTSDDIDHYMKSKLGSKKDIWIQKFKFSVS
ncbi:hypothetical protein DOY81_011046, partial [Sarcophaga bullata]